MKIIKNKTFDYIEFGSLNSGEVFQAIDGKYYLKTKTFVPESSKYCVNAVLMEQGECTFFNLDEKVIAVKATLVIDED